MQKIQDNNQLRSSHIEVNSNRKKTISLHDLANITLFIAVFIGIWQLVYVIHIWPEVSLPSPVKVGESFVGMFENLTLITSIGMTMYRLVIGFGISIVIGVVVGLSMVKFPGFGKTMSLICCRTAILPKCGVGSICHTVNRT